MIKQLGIIPVRVELPFRLNHVNCFMAEGDKGWTIIDAGLNNDYTRALWNQHIGDKQITDVLITHYHPDHFGYAGGLQEKTGARISMTRVDAEAGSKSWTEKFLGTMPAHYRSSGIPEESAQQMLDNTADFVPLVSPLPSIDHFLVEGEKVQIGRLQYEIVFTPGHSDGMACFYNKERSVLLSADHILPKITPNISYWHHGNPNPLQAFLDSLDKTRELDVEFVIPSHGKPFYGANERIDELKKHHDERLDETLEAITSASTVYEVCERLFKRPLTTHETRFAVGETLAHLEYLRYAGESQREKEGERWIYQRID